MKPIKMLGLAMLAALMAMAFVGAGSAMAESTALCEEDESPCSFKIHHLHEVTTEKAKLLFRPSGPTVECDVLFLGDVTSTNNLGNPLLISGAFTYSNCGSGCSVVEEKGPTKTIFLKEGHELAKYTILLTNKSQINVNCFGIQCRYSLAGISGHLLGPLLSEVSNGGVSFEEQSSSEEEGFLCKVLKLDLRLTSLSPTYISS